MFDLGWTELFIVGLITLLVVGPKELPRVLRTISQVMAKARGLAREFQSSVDDMVRESELDDLKKEINALKGEADISGQMRSMMRDAEKDLETELETDAKSASDAPKTDKATTLEDPVAAANKAATEWPHSPDKSDVPLVDDPGKTKQPVAEPAAENEKPVTSKQASMS